MADFADPRISSFNPAQANGESRDNEPNYDTLNITRQDIIDLYARFVLEFEQNRVRIYRDQLQINFQQHDYSLNVDLHDLHAWSSEKSSSFDMRNYLIANPTAIIPLFELAIQNALKMMVNDISVQSIPPFQLTLHNYPDIRPIGSLQGRDMNRIVVIQGIVVSALKPQLKAIALKLKCRNCGYQMTEKAESMSAYASIPLPTRCPQGGIGGAGAALQADQPPCPSAPFEIVADDCSYIDTQELKLQEAPEQVKSGEMPRQIKLSLNRTLVDRVKPGSRVTAIGIYTTVSGTRKGGGGGLRDGGNAVNYAVPYLSVVGIYTDSSAAQIVEGLISDEEQQELRELVNNSTNIYERIAKSVATSIMGKDDVKKAIACSLFGGVAKKLPDGMTLRGDINVLLLGDPSVAKSQFLKFSSQVAPISVYTSGKGSSAAGLTAAVVRSQATGEFHLEAGALVLADGGLVCIDEFDKMREQDRVAIHEAMEQQTISIAKAGITTILNSRCSVLAAANPVFGRYDDMKSPTENIDFQATILSRFDLIFILRDVQEDAMDEGLASHIINVHKFGDQQPDANNTRQQQISWDTEMGDNVGTSAAQQSPMGNTANLTDDGEEPIKPDQLKKLIAYSRRFHPKLSQAAKEELMNKYVAFREENEKRRAAGENSVIPITVRQLEAIIRISEAIARMSLSEEATPNHVKEAIRLFQVATMQSASNDFSQQNSTIPGNTAATSQAIQSCETYILGRIPTGGTTPTRHLLTELAAYGYDEYTCKRAVTNLVRRNVLMFQQQRKVLKKVAAAGGP